MTASMARKSVTVAVKSIPPARDRVSAGLGDTVPAVTLAVPPLTCEQGHVGVLGVVGTPGHAADVVPNRLQRVHLEGVTGGREDTTRGPHPEGAQAGVGTDSVEGVDAADPSHGCPLLPSPQNPSHGCPLRP